MADDGVAMLLLRAWGQRLLSGRWCRGNRWRQSVSDWECVDVAVAQARGRDGQSGRQGRAISGREFRGGDSAVLN